jgi:hypothetical protein
MANERLPEDPFRSGLSDDDFNRTSRYDHDLPPLDRDLDGGPSGGKVALFAVGIALILGAVFYGLNNTSTHQATNPPPTQSAQSERASPQAPSGMRDMTPRANTQPGTTTGSAPAAPPATAPSTMNKPSEGAPK